MRNSLFQHSLYENRLLLQSICVDAVLKLVAQYTSERYRLRHGDAVLRAMLDSDEAQQLFWVEMNGAREVIDLWAKHTCGNEKQPCDVDVTYGVRVAVWKTFLERVSLDEWMLFRTRRHAPSGGNDLVRLFVETSKACVYTIIAIQDD